MVYKPLSEEQILQWAHAHYKRTGQWPKYDSGKIKGGDGETWASINQDLRKGLRGLSGNTTLARLLSDHCGARSSSLPSLLTYEMILQWADVHFTKNGRWPKANSGPVLGAPGETWYNIRQALAKGLRGLPKGLTLPQLLENERDVRNIRNLPKLNERQIFEWAEAHYKQHGSWPSYSSGPVDGVQGETWRNIDQSLRRGIRGLKKKTSLTKLLSDYQRKQRSKIVGRVPKPRTRKAAAVLDAAVLDAAVPVGVAESATQVATLLPTAAAGKHSARAGGKAKTKPKPR